MPQAAAAVFSFATSVLSGAALGGGLAGALAQTVAIGAVSAGLNSAIANNSRARDQGGLINLQLDPSAPRRLIIGKRATGGVLVDWYLAGTNNTRLYLPIYLSEGPCNGLTKVWAGGREVWSTPLVHGVKTEIPDFRSGGPRLWLTWYDGRAGQTADPTLVGLSQGWTSANTMTGCAYVVVECWWDSDNLRSPPQLTFEVEGAKLYDRRLDTTAGGSGSHRLNDPSTWAYTGNPAVALDHYRMGWSPSGVKVLGPGEDADDWAYADFASQANVCDEDVDLKAGGTQKRYRAAGFIFANDDRASIITKLCQAMAARPADYGGRFGVISSEAKSVVLTIDDDDMIESVPEVYSPKRTWAELVTAVEGRWQDPAQVYQPVDFPRVTDAAWVTADGGEGRTATLALEFEVDVERAQRLATLFARSERRQATLEGVYPIWAVELEPGDWFERTGPKWGDGKTFEVLQRVYDPTTHTVRLTSREVDPADSAWDESVAQDGPPAPLSSTDAVAVLPAPVITAEAKTLAGSQASIPTINISWTQPTDQRITQMLIEATSTATGDVSTVLCDPSAETMVLDAGIMDGTQYTIRSRHFGGSQRSAWSNVEVITTGDKYVVIEVSNPFLDFVDDIVNVRGPLQGHANDGTDVAPIANPVTTRTPWDIRGQTVLDSGREFLVTLGLVVDQGSGAAEGEPRHKVALYSGLQALSGGGDVWSLNTVVTLESGHGKTGHGYELDFNNNSGTHRDVFGTTSAWGMGITGAGSYRATGALYVSGPGTHPIWQYGVVLLNGSVNSIGFLDQTDADIGLAIQGAKGLYAIDTALCAPATGTGIRLRNNTYLSALNAAGSADIWIAKVGADDHIYVRDIIAKSGGGVDITGDVAVARTSAAAVFTLSASTLQDRILRWSTAGVRRWDLTADGGAEAGSDAGSDWALRSYDDSGNYLATPIAVTRSDGRIALNGPVIFTANPTLPAVGDGNGFQALAGSTFIYGISRYINSARISSYDSVYIEEDATGGIGTGNTYLVWHAGNSPKDTAATANTLALRDGSGQLHAQALYLNRTGALYVNSDLSALFPPGDGGNVWYLQSDSAASTGLAVRTSDGHVRGFVYGDSAGSFGLLNSSGGWVLQCNTGSSIGYLFGAPMFTGQTNAWQASADSDERVYYVADGATIHKSAGGHEWRNSADAWRLFLDNATDGVMSLRGTAPRFMLRDTAGIGSGFLSYNGYLYLVRQDGADSTGFDTGPGGNHPLVVNLTNGNATLAGTLTELSDVRFKHDVEPFRSALDLLRRMPAAVSYRKSAIDRREVGWIAQDLLPIAPWLVETTSPTGVLSIAYGRAAPIIAEAVRELADTVDELRAALAALLGDDDEK